jgi:hypothetical protein
MLNSKLEMLLQPVKVSYNVIKELRYTMVLLWTWLVLVPKGKRRNLPFRNGSDNRTKIALDLLFR